MQIVVLLYAVSRMHQPLGEVTDHKLALVGSSYLLAEEVQDQAVLEACESLA